MNDAVLVGLLWVGAGVCFSTGWVLSACVTQWRVNFWRGRFERADAKLAMESRPQPTLDFPRPMSCRVGAESAS